MNETSSAHVAASTHYGWIGTLVASGGPLPPSLGLIVRVFDDIADFYEGAMAITRAGGLIVEVDERENGLIDVVLAITADGFEELAGRPAEPYEWLKMEPQQ
jgi:hypothetical protein